MINCQKKSYMQMYLPHTPSKNSRLLNFIGFMVIEESITNTRSFYVSILSRIAEKLKDLRI